MTKKLTYIGIVLMGVIVLLNPLKAQNTNDTVPLITPDSTLITLSDSLMVKDSIVLDSAFISDSIVMDSIALSDSLNQKASKWNFITGGNDSTYYSFFGHLINTHDTIKINNWRYNIYTHELKISEFDSTLNDFQNFHPAFKKSFNNNYLGNTGLAVKSNLYFEPLQKSDFIFINAFETYNFSSENAEYYNVLKPFTKFDAHIGPKDEQNIEVLHTQNINPYLNGFIRFKNYTGKGNYISQETRNNSGIIGGSYTQGPIATHINYNFNNINAQENGGVTDPFFITDTIISTNQISAKLSNASNYFKDRKLFIDQKIGLFKSNIKDSAKLGDYRLSIQYNYFHQNSLKIYEDDTTGYNNSRTKEWLYFYPNTYNDAATFDSSHFFIRKQLFRLNLEEIPYNYPFVGAYFGFGTEKAEYSYFNTDTLFNNSQSKTQKSTYLEGGIYRLRGEKFKFSGSYTFYISGYKQTDFTLDGFISQKFGNDSNYFVLKAEGGIYLESPDYFLMNYKSNHFRWNNENFKQIKRTELKFDFSYPKFNINAGARFSTLTDFVFFNNEALPDQFIGTFALLDVYFNNRLELGPFGLKTQLNYQKTGNSTVLPLPEFSGYAALYWAPKVYFANTEGRMKFNIGTDLYYWTSFYAPSYSPASSQFHTQKDQLVGNYPFWGAYLNFEIKRLRFYLRTEHISYNLFETNYFMAPNYPSPRFVIRYGIAWTFYD
ncbi:MAG: hypothetical protein JEZ09_17130 [Salinivirgaceae bacterium]|nr:hypothetical protein [Salinivirgaceae bacterium]